MVQTARGSTLVWLGLLGLTACAPEYVSQHMIDRVAAEISPGRGVSTDDLQSTGNPRGEGAIVFVRQTASSATDTPIAWILLEGQVFAVDRKSQAITPGVPLASDAPVRLVTQSGLGKDGLLERDVAEIVRASVR